MKDSLRDIVGSLASNLLIAGWVTAAVLSLVVLRYSWGDGSTETRPIIERIGSTAFAIAPIAAAIALSWFGAQMLMKKRQGLGIKLMWAGALLMIFVTFWPWSGSFMHAPAMAALVIGTFIAAKRLSAPKTKRTL